MKKTKIGVVGCGNISGIYFENLTKLFKNIKVIACADLDSKRAKEAAEKYGIPNILTFEQMLDSSEVRIILNLTTPPAHYSICKRCLLAGKHVYVEKPLSLEFEEGKELLQIAKEKNLQIGCAPDTFMGAAIQTCCKLIDNGFIGEIVGATAFMMGNGPESWHPNPEFYYNPGGGPMLDMGPYYLTALVNMLGNATEVCGLNNISTPTRTITAQANYGQKIDVKVDTHSAGLIRFESGAVGTIITSFDVQGSTLPRIEVYGTKGTIVAPDPNHFGGEVLLATKADKEFKSVPHTHIYTENSRGLGLAQMAKSIDAKIPALAGGELACHVLEIMHGIKKSDTEKSFYKMTTSFNASRMSTDLIPGMV